MDLSHNKAGQSTSEVVEDKTVNQDNSHHTEKNDDSPSTNNKKRKLDDEESSSKKIRIEGIGAVVASHYNNIDEKGFAHRNRSNIFFMRNFNNWVKSILIDKFISKTRRDKYEETAVIDLGCGKGGDIFKWVKNFVNHVIFVDIAESSMTQCRERYLTQRSRGQQNRLFSAEFIVADFSKIKLNRHLKNSMQKVDFISCQFAIHYAFESLPQAEQLIRNVSENLRSGGYFIATFPNAYKIMAASQKQGDENGSSSGRNDFGNDVFKISFDDDDSKSDPPLFGDKYHFNLEGVVDCPEFFVHLATLVRICEKYDLQCAYVENFENIFEEYKKDNFYVKLLHKMNCLERFPKNHSEQQDSKEYASAERHLAKTRERSIMTISASEWEAICLYMAVAFRKK